MLDGSPPRLPRAATLPDYSRRWCRQCESVTVHWREGAPTPRGTALSILALAITPAWLVIESLALQGMPWVDPAMVEAEEGFLTPAQPCPVLGGVSSPSPGASPMSEDPDELVPALLRKLAETKEDARDHFEEIAATLGRLADELDEQGWPGTSAEEYEELRSELYAATRQVDAAILDRPGSRNSLGPRPVACPRPPRSPWGRLLPHCLVCCK
jgi:hypothetical protein